MKKRDKVIGYIVGVLALFLIAGCGVLNLTPLGNAPEPMYVSMANLDQ